jgi:hypothetical protein
MVGQELVNPTGYPFTGTLRTLPHMIIDTPV